jgi:acyl-CoA synthetase (AMP-forming)/AMP-acid ligase II
LQWGELLATTGVGERDRAWLERLRPDANTVTELAFTSGTTGVPKGVLHTHNTAVATVGSTMRRQGIDHTKVVHVVTPVGHNAGYFYGVRISLQGGATIVFQDIWDPKEALRLIQEHRVTFSYGASTFLIDLLACPEFDEHDLSSFEIYMCGGASIPPALAEECMRRLPGRLCPIFGMTEHGHSTGTDPDTPFEKVCSTDGSPQPEMELKVVDEYGRRLPPCTEGRLMLRGPFNFIGYIQGREFSEQFFDDEDFFDTGDLAYLDEDGYVRITGRAKDLIIRGGENVPVKEVEDILARHPDILEVALVGAPDPRLGERGVAFLRMLPARSMSLEQMRDFLRAEQVTQQFWPEAVQIVDEFPRTASGKIQKFKLRESVGTLFG